MSSPAALRAAERLWAMNGWQSPESLAALIDAEFAAHGESLSERAARINTVMKLNAERAELIEALLGLSATVSKLTNDDYRDTMLDWANRKAQAVLTKYK